MIYKKLNKIQFFLAITTSFFIFLFYFSFNYNYLSQWIDEKGDARTYDYYVRLGIPTENQIVEDKSYNYLFNPHHILFDWVGQKMAIALINQGYEGKVMIVLQLRNLIASSLGLALLFLFMYRFSHKYLLSLLLVTTIAFCCAYWMYSQINDTPIIHSVMVCLLFFLTIFFPQAKRKYWYAIFLGIFHGFNIFFHQSDILMIFVILFVMMAYPYHIDAHQVHSKLPFYSHKKLTRLPELKWYPVKYFSTYLLTLLLVVSIGYYYVGIVLIGLTLDKAQAQDFNKIKDANYFFNWLVLYSKIDVWGNGYENTNILKSISTGISTYFYQPQEYDGQILRMDMQNFFASYSILPNLIITLFIFVFSSFFIFIKKIYQKYHYIIIANLIFLLIYTAFSCWWEPDYREFWVATMFAFWILTFLILNFYLDQLKKLNPIAPVIIYSYLFIFSCLLFYFNFTAFIYPNIGTTFQFFDIMK
ncbi:MAG: hypothetical protein MJB14_14300 [Spirochaetes bacterium]|nr:hypothetical protein [Spirochaetota bacterium]